jgi:hypothetical protein
MLTRKHFCALAEALSWERPTGHPAEYKGWERAVAAVADVCQASNGNFNRDTFLRACGIT